MIGTYYIGKPKFQQEIANQAKNSIILKVYLYFTQKSTGLNRKMSILNSTKSGIDKLHYKPKSNYISGTRKCYSYKISLESNDSPFMGKKPKLTTCPNNDTNVAYNI